MRLLALISISCALAALPAEAQQSSMMTFRIEGSRAKAVVPPSNAPKPYEPVTFKTPTAPEDETFETFRKQLTTIANGRVYADLERLVAVQGFFWDRDFNGRFERKLAAVDNLAAAVHLEHRNGMGWSMIAAFAAEPTATPFTGRPGIICSPGEVSFDDVDFDRLVDTTRSKTRDWFYPRTDKTAVLAAPRDNTKTIDTLGLTLVRLMAYLSKDSEPETARTAWARVITPAGKTGFVAPGALISLSPERLCYGKDGFGRWRIAGYVGGGD